MIGEGNMVQKNIPRNMKNNIHNPAIRMLFTGN